MTELLIKTKLTPEVLEGLNAKEEYFCSDGGDRFAIEGEYLVRNYRNFTHIYLPLTVTEQMVECAASEYEIAESFGYSDNITGMYKNMDFVAGVNWLLSLNKDKE